LEVFTYVTDFPDPKPGKGEVLIKVEATALNQIDLIVRKGYPGISIALPHILGGDISGKVAEVGEGVGHVSAGARVVCYPLVACSECALCAEGKRNLCLNWKYFGLHLRGGYAEYVVVPAQNVISLPASASFEEAVVIPVAGLTAYHAIKTVGALQEGETFFIWGGMGQRWK
jgi:NADPH:quinone reductase-like Zn-dependent oxidoreductase